MKRSSVKELLIFVLWILTEASGYFINQHFGSNADKIFLVSVVVLFEAYVFFQLPGSQYFWNAAEHSEDPKHGKVRLAVMACIVAILIFVFNWIYFSALYFIATIRIDGIINFFRVSQEERHRIFETEGIPELKSYLHILVAIPVVLALFATAFICFINHLSSKPSVKIRNAATQQMDDLLHEVVQKEELQQKKNQETVQQMQDLIKKHGKEIREETLLQANDILQEALKIKRQQESEQLVILLQANLLVRQAKQKLDANQHGSKDAELQKENEKIRQETLQQLQTLLKEAIKSEELQGKKQQKMMRQAEALLNADLKKQQLNVKRNRSNNATHQKRPVAKKRRVRGENA